MEYLISNNIEGDGVFEISHHSELHNITYQIFKYNCICILHFMI